MFYITDKMTTININCAHKKGFYNERYRNKAGKHRKCDLSYRR